VRRAAVRYSPFALRRLLSAISYQLSAISYQLSAISYQLSAISYQRKPDPQIASREFQSYGESLAFFVCGHGMTRSTTTSPSWS
jgi:hypothetical protein